MLITHVSRPGDDRLPAPCPDTVQELSTRHAALYRLGQWLQEQDYHFICPSPESHARVNARPRNQLAYGLTDVFGWSRPFHRGSLPSEVLELLDEASSLNEDGELLRSRVRYSSVAQRLLVHSAFPTNDWDAVFLGPDTYRFVTFIKRCLPSSWPYPVNRLADIGCGSGAGAIFAADALEKPALRRVVFSDINETALHYSRSNVALNVDALRGVSDIEFVEGPGLSGTDGDFDLIVSNPPYIVDSQLRAYCHGGQRWGTEVAIDILGESLARLAPGGRLLLYTGTPVVNGQNMFELASQPLLEQAQVDYRYVDIDPDVFSEELQRKEYEMVDRIAVIGLVASRPGGDR